jgi:hypothetical protein
MSNFVPHSKNIDGDFFVEDGCCMRCLVPVEHVPDMLKYDDSVSHCYVYKQPGTLDEETRMIQAVGMSEVFCIHYCGSSQSVLDQLKANRRFEQCNPRGTPLTQGESVVNAEMDTALPPEIAITKRDV